jgi:hypothetical protein
MAQVTIEVLIGAVPPPAAPFESFSGPWEPIQAALGTALPPDYKEFVRLYGSGYFMAFLGVDVPKSRNPNVRLERQVPAICDSFFDRDELPYPLWPEPGGLLPFGGTDNGDCLFWLPRGSSPEDWGVVVWDRASQEFEAFDCDLTDFLAGLATGEILPEAFPADLLYCDELFEPHGPPPAFFSVSWTLGGFGARGLSTCRLR